MLYTQGRKNKHEDRKTQRHKVSSLYFSSWLLFYNFLNYFRMKKFISSKLFLSLQEASQAGIDKDAHILKNEYDEFASLVLSSASTTDKVLYYYNLVYTSIELGCLTLVSGKKCGNIFRQSCPVS